MHLFVRLSNAEDQLSRSQAITFPATTGLQIGLRSSYLNLTCITNSIVDCVAEVLLRLVMVVRALMFTALPASVLICVGGFSALTN